MLRILLAAIAFYFTSQTSLAKEVKLSLHHFLPATSLTQTKFLQPFVDKIHKSSEGQIKITIYPSMTLGGKPAELYRQVRDGTVDIIWTVTGYTPGLFPRSEVFGLPSVHNNSAYVTNQAIQDLSKEIASDFKDIKLLLLHVHTGNVLHLREKCIENPRDLVGKKIRTPSQTGGYLIEAFGASAVGMPVPDLPIALSKGVIDGALIPFQILPSLNLHEITKCSITLFNDIRFGTAVFLLAMNKKRYNKLEPHIQKIIDENIAPGLAKQAGIIWDEIEIIGHNLQIASGSPVKQLNNQISLEFEKFSLDVEKKWLTKQIKLGNLDAEILLKKAKKLVRKYSK